jgi:hypothetical protein
MLVTSLSPSNPPYQPFSDDLPQMVYLIWVKQAVVLQPWKAGWFTVSYKERNKLALPEPSTVKVDGTLQIRC